MKVLGAVLTIDWIIIQGVDGVDHCYITLVIDMLLPIRLEAVLVIIEVHEMAFIQHGLVLEAVDHIECHLAPTPWYVIPPIPPPTPHTIA